MNEIKERLLAHGGFVASIVSNLKLNEWLAAIVSISWIIYIWRKILARKQRKGDE